MEEGNARHFLSETQAQGKKQIPKSLNQMRSVSLWKSLLRGQYTL